MTEFVDKHVIDVSNKIAALVSERLDTFQQNFIYAMSLHISSFLEKIQGYRNARDECQYSGNTRIIQQSLQ